ncbi:MCT family MFS transporter [Aspergillus homomorphus CBS 101889]|uniref:Putative monocarboxylate permease n=1 Tax=Aspergillus homomorphus (strain CBS 101889) TaxID=1450537 RepID=A0A395HLD8_ASPHC|nr:putative monocarboxylate permease [Aspergillus homomorphus CBS 101889]RAL08253.1 putative monocarboxylate permease [Aspergillus homomorphus CBS 101889]
MSELAESTKEQYLEPAITGKVGDADPDTFPDGGLRAWSVALGNAGVMFCTLGYVNSWSVYQAYYEGHQLRDVSPSAIAWIGSLQAFFIFGSGLIGGPLFDRMGAKVIYPAAIIYLFSIFMTSLCKEYYQFMLAQGILGGLANGFTMSPSMAATPQYFKKKRGAAMGLAIAGSSIGGVILPIALNQLITQTDLGFGWSVRIVGFLMLVVLIPSCLAIRARLPPRKTHFFLPGAFKDRSYSLLIACMFFTFLGLFPPMFYIPSWALTQGMGATLAFYLAAILNAASFPGRVIPAVLSDKIGPLNVLCVAGLTTGILTLCWQRVEGNAGIIVFTAIFGFCSGAIISGAVIPLASCTKTAQNIGTYMGMGMAVGSLAVLAGPPATGAMYERYHDFDAVSTFCGMMCLVGALLVIPVKIVSGHALLSKT